MRWGSARRGWACEAMPPDLVTVGGLTIDNVIAADGRVALARAGGNAAYSAVGARLWVDAVGLVSIAPASYPRETLDRLAADGILLDGVVRHPARLEYGDWFIYDEAGNRNEKLRSKPGALAGAGFAGDRLSRADMTRWIELLRSAPPPAEMSYSQFRDANPLTAAQVPAHYLKARGVHLAPCRPLVLHAMLSRFGPTGMRVTLDPGWQLAGERLDDLAPLLAAVDAFLPSEVELESLVPGAGIEDSLAALAGHCRGTVAVKRGPQGSLVWDRAHGRAVAVPVIPTATVDPTGAGDSWSGGFLAGLVETGDPLLAACFGTVSASRIVSCFGADGALPVDRADGREKIAQLVARVKPERR
jgi:sugar/nucleoside kinase (ribokinase family)